MEKEEKHKMSNKSWQRHHYACCTVSQIHNRFTDNLDNLNAKKGREKTVALPGAEQRLGLQWMTKFMHLGAQIPGCDVG